MQLLPCGTSTIEVAHTKVQLAILAPVMRNACVLPPVQQLLPGQQTTLILIKGNKEKLRKQCQPHKY